MTHEELEAMVIAMAARETVLTEKLNFLEGLSRDHDQILQTLYQRYQESESHRNSSSPMFRDMTTADAERVLVGDLAHLKHKDAAARIGLTYAQVYSCRFCYTFKETHRALEATGWRSKWVRKG